MIVSSSTRTPFPQVSVNSEAGVSIGVITRVVIVFSVGVLVEMIVGLGISFGGATTTGMITGPEITFGGAISGEKTLPLLVILLVPVMLLISESTFS